MAWLPADFISPNINSAVSTLMSSFAGWIVLIFMFVFIGGGAWFIMHSRRFDYYCNIYSQKGSGIICNQFKGRRIGRIDEVEKLLILETKEEIAMPDGNYVYPYGKKGLINFIRDASRDLHPSQFFTDEKNNVFLKASEQDIKFWFINQTKERVAWQDIKSKWMQNLPIIVIIVLGFCFLMFLFYMNKTHSEDTAQYAQLDQKFITQNKELGERQIMATELLTQAINKMTGGGLKYG